MRGLEPRLSKYLTVKYIYILKKKKKQNRLIKDQLLTSDFSLCLIWVPVPSSALLYINSCFKFQRLLLKMYVEYIRNVKS